MRVLTTNQGIAREAADGTLEVLELPDADLSTILAADPELRRVREGAVRHRVSVEDVKVLAPIARPGKIICMGINYGSHVEEMKPVLERLGGEVPKDPVFFLVPGSAVCGPDQPLVLPDFAPDQVDYEVELAAVIGRGGSRRWWPRSTRPERTCAPPGKRSGRWPRPARRFRLRCADLRIHRAASGRGSARVHALTCSISGLLHLPRIRE